MDIHGEVHVYQSYELSVPYFYHSNVLELVTPVVNSNFFRAVARLRLCRLAARPVGVTSPLGGTKKGHFLRSALFLSFELWAISRFPGDLQGTHPDIAIADLVVVIL